MRKLLIVTAVSLLFTGCAQVEKTVNMALTGGVRMEMVMRECEPRPIFTQYAQCIKTTYTEKGNYPNAGNIRNFYAQMDEISEMYSRRSLTEAQARAQLYRVWDVTINQVNKLDEAIQATRRPAVQPYQFPQTITCTGTGSIRTCSSN
jgi:hypothetical protein